MQIDVAALHGEIAALVVPCGKSRNPAVVPFPTKMGAT
jgi:hypothetical protein